MAAFENRCSQKFREVDRETLVINSFSNKVALDYNFIKKDFMADVFLSIRNFAEHLLCNNQISKQSTSKSLYNNAPMGGSNPLE